MDIEQRLSIYGSKIDPFVFQSNLGLDDMVSALKKALIGYGWHKKQFDSSEYISGQMDYGTKIAIRYDHDNQDSIGTSTYVLKLHTSCNTEELSEMLSKVPKIIANLGSSCTKSSKQDKKEKLRKDDLISLIEAGIPSSEIIKAYSGHTMKEIAGIKSWLTKRSRL